MVLTGRHDSVVLKIDAHSYCSYCSCMPDSIYVSLVRVECLFADCISYRSCCLFNQPCKTTQETLKPFVKRKEEKKQSKNKPPSVGIEPTTTWLKATRSTTELGRQLRYNIPFRSKNLGSSNVDALKYKIEFAQLVIDRQYGKFHAGH